MRRSIGTVLLLASILLFAGGAATQGNAQPAPSTSPTTAAPAPPPLAAPRQAIDSNGKSSTELDEKFRALRRQRSELIRRIDEIKTQLGTIRDGLQRKEEKLQRLKEEAEIGGSVYAGPLPGSGPSLESATREQQNVEKLITELRSKIDARKNPDPQMDSQLRELERKEEGISSYLDSLKQRLDAEKQRQAQASARRQQQQDLYKALNTDIEADRARAQRLVQELGDELIKQSVLEDDLNDLLKTETQRNDFKTKIALAFTALVFLVILGFFGLSWKDEMVRRAIFSGESGIQFLTLFSVVIAIILFGITGILESKELSALLGGLSGYILGRVSSTMQRPTPTAPQPAPNPTPVANPATG